MRLLLRLLLLYWWWRLLHWWWRLRRLRLRKLRWVEVWQALLWSTITSEGARWGRWGHSPCWKAEQGFVPEYCRLWRLWRRRWVCTRGKLVRLS